MVKLSQTDLFHRIPTCNQCVRLSKDPQEHQGLGNPAKRVNGKRKRSGEGYIYTPDTRAILK